MSLSWSSYVRPFVRSYLLAWYSRYKTSSWNSSWVSPSPLHLCWPQCGPHFLSARNAPGHQACNRVREFDSWPYSDLTDEADDTLFSQITANHGHFLQPLLPDRHSIPYSLREWSHNKTLLNKSSSSTHLNNDDFLIRMLYKDSY